MQYKYLALFCGGAVVGGLVGYVASVKHLEKKYIEIADEEIEKVRQHYRFVRKGSLEDIYKDVNLKSDEELVSIDLSLEEEVDPDLDVVVSTEKVEHILEEQEHMERLNGKKLVRDGVSDDHPGFVVADEDDVEDEDDDIRVEWNSLKEAQPSDEDPYLITIDEYMDDEEDFEKITLTYFEGDDTLCDERESIIPDVDTVVGVDNLKFFGRSSSTVYEPDANAVYIRNVRVQSDFEVIREEMSYSEAVLGMTPEFLGSKLPKAKPRKMREDD